MQPLQLKKFHVLLLDRWDDGRGCVLLDAARRIRGERLSIKPTLTDTAPSAGCITSPARRLTKWYRRRWSACDQKRTLTAETALSLLKLWNHASVSSPWVSPTSRALRPFTKV